MTVYIASLIVIGFVCVAFLFAQDRRDRRERSERAELLQRIQAPHAAIAEHHHRVDPPAEPGTGLPMTDAEMVELEGGPPNVEQDRQQLIAWMEAIENGTVQPEDGVIQ